MVKLIENHFQIHTDSKLIRNEELDNNNNNNNYIPPSNEIEFKLVEIWKNLLGGLDKIGINDNFFELGGDSIMAIQLVSRIQLIFNQKIKVKDIFNYQSINQLATLLYNNINININDSSKQYEYSYEYENKTAKLPTISFKRRKRNLFLPLTLIQKQLYNIINENDSTHQKQNNNNNIMIQLFSKEYKSLITTTMTPIYLEEIFKMIIFHHDILRMQLIKLNNKNYQTFEEDFKYKKYTPLSFQYINILKLFEIKQVIDKNIINKNMIKQLEKGLNLNKGPLLRFIAFSNMPQPSYTQKKEEKEKIQTYKKGKNQMNTNINVFFSLLFMIIIHPIMVDNNSLIILLEDLKYIFYKNISIIGKIQLPIKLLLKNTFKYWIINTTEYSQFNENNNNLISFEFKKNVIINDKKIFKNIIIVMMIMIIISYYEKIIIIFNKKTNILSLLWYM